MPSRKKKTAVKQQSSNRVITVNRQATFNYEILERYEAGLALTGTEIKSVRAGRVDLREAYARPQDRELWLLNAHIAQYDPASIFNHDPRRPRKLLMHREEIEKLTAEVAQKGLTLVALRLYIKTTWPKLNWVWPGASGSTTSGEPSATGNWTWLRARPCGRRGNHWPEFPSFPSPPHSSNQLPAPARSTGLASWGIMRH